MSSPITPLVLQQVRPLAPNTLHLTFKAEHDGALPFVPGQFVSLHFELDGEVLRRSYSIANRSDAPAEARHLEFAIAGVDGGKATRFFFQAEPGAQVGMSGPFGLLLLPETLPARTLLIATGTGVAPYRAMLPRLEQELRACPAKQAIVLFGCRTRAEALYSDEFRALAGKLPNFHYRLCVSREAPQLADERAGYVQDALQALAPTPDTDMAYLCGNPAMVDAVFALVKERGFGVKNVRREKYVFSGK